MALNMIGEPGICPECRGDTVVPVDVPAAPHMAEALKRKGPLTDVVAMSQDPESRRVLKLHYSRDVTQADRDALCAAHNALPAPDEKDAEIARLREALAYILDGYGLDAPLYEQPDGENDDWIVTRVRAALSPT